MIQTTRLHCTRRSTNQRFNTQRQSVNAVRGNPLTYFRPTDMKADSLMQLLGQAAARVRQSQVCMQG